MVGRICTRVVVTAAPKESVLDVVRRMEAHNVGTVVVVSAEMAPIGIVTDRDVVLRCTARELDPSLVPIEAIMTEEARTVDESTPIERALSVMAQAGHRRVVVTGEGGRLVGVLSMDDVIGLLVEEAGSIGALLDREVPHLTSPS